MDADNPLCRVRRNRMADTFRLSRCLEGSRCSHLLRLGICGEPGLGVASCRTWLWCAGHLALRMSLLLARGKPSVLCSCYKHRERRGSKTGWVSRTAAALRWGLWTSPLWLPSVNGREKVYSASLLCFHPHSCGPATWYFRRGGDGGQAQ